MSAEPRIAIFHRKEGWYPVKFLDPDECGLSMSEQAADHAKANPGTLRVTVALTDEELWRDTSE